MLTLINKLQSLLDKTHAIDFIGPLALRLYLTPIFWMAGSLKFTDMPSTIAWFGSTDWGLGLPLPALMAWMAALTETAGAVLLLIGLGVRWISIPLMITMLVAAVAVHWQNGWLVIAEGTDSLFASERTLGAIERLDKARSLLKEHGNYDWLTEQGSFVVLNNGIEFAATYFIMLLMLFFIGGGRYFSLDHWIAQRLKNR